MLVEAPPTTRILVVEDEEVIRDLLMMVFEREGLEATCAGTTAEALSRLDDCPTHITLDLHLPDGRGTEVLQEVRTRGLPARVAVTTGTIDPALLRIVSDLHPDRIFQKPFRTSVLVK